MILTPPLRSSIPTPAALAWVLAFVILYIPTRTGTTRAAELDPAATGPNRVAAVTLSGDQMAACERLNIAPEQITQLIAKPLYQCDESEVDTYLRFLHATEPDIRKRVMHLARKNLGQPYELYLLGELPFEHFDPQPLYCLSKSDCLVFAEHTYAMALGENWPSFFGLLQRIRYIDGRIGVVTRNHYTEVDWNRSNRWLVRDITQDIAGERAVVFEQKIDRARFFQKRYGLTVEIPVETHRDQYVRFEDIGLAKPHLADGDFVNIVRGIVQPDAPPNATFGGSAWVGHVGLIGHGPDGQPHLIHSAKPAVREERLDDYIAKEAEKVPQRDAAGKSRLLGFKFLRLGPHPLDKLRGIDGPHAPKLTLPTGGPVTF